MTHIYRNKTENVSVMTTWAARATDLTSAFCHWLASRPGTHAVIVEGTTVHFVYTGNCPFLLDGIAEARAEFEREVAERKAKNEPHTCPRCGTVGEFINVTDEEDERGWYYDIYRCPLCEHYFQDDDHPMVFDDQDGFVEVEQTA